MYENYKYLKKGLQKQKGRNFRGKITVYHKGGGNKHCYRQIDFQHNNTLGLVKKIEYDPNRSSDIALMLKPLTKRYYYILASKNLTINSLIKHYTINDSAKVHNIIDGFSMPLFNIPLNTPIHKIELHPYQGSSLVRSAGSYAFIIKKDSDINGFAYIKLGAKRIKKIPLCCIASIGKVSNSFHNLYAYKSAGNMRHFNKRPVVRGVAMNPIDHPHGGGEGKSSGGRVSVTPWGIITKGHKTVKHKKHEY